MPRGAPTSSPKTPITGVHGHWLRSHHEKVACHFVTADPEDSCFRRNDGWLAALAGKSVS